MCSRAAATAAADRDYQANPEQDRYESEAIDDDVDEEDAEEGYANRVAAEEAMDARDATRGRKRLPGAFAGAWLAALQALM